MTDKSTADLAVTFAETVRALNHDTLDYRRHSLYDVYMVTGQLATGIGRCNQLLGQLAMIVTFRCSHTEPSAADTALRIAADAVAALGEALYRAHQALGQLRDDGTT